MINFFPRAFICFLSNSLISLLPWGIWIWIYLNLNLLIKYRLCNHKGWNTSTITGLVD
jgi:hypothetical protein